MSPLHRLAAAAGLQIDWHDAAGQPQRVADEALRTVLTALGYPAEDGSALASSVERCVEEGRSATFVSGDIGRPILLPEACDAPIGPVEIRLENGATLQSRIGRTRDGLVLSPIDVIGYHDATIGDCDIRLAIAPARCLSPADLTGRARPWGVAVQTPSLRDDLPSAFGGFCTLAAAAKALAAAGADALAISPAHALFPADAARYSPYAPSSRLFLNVLFGDPALVGCPIPPEPQTAPELIDWQQAIPQRMAALRQAFDQRSGTDREGIAIWRAQQGIELERHAIFDALFARHFADGARGWQDWPSEYHEPASDAVARFAGENRDEVEFYVFAQWLASASLDSAQQAARDAGMGIGLIADLAVGMDGGGSHAWSQREDLLTGLSVGAPPDLLGPQGQNWGLTGFSPAALRRTGFKAFIATLRAAMRHAGGVRIDHILGLARLWVIPHGQSSADGAYLTYPLDDMLRILAIESHRARAIVIGEDLGTVPDGLRPLLRQRGVLGMRVLWFERDDDGDFIPPDRWESSAVAMTGTHDLVTVAGWWQAGDIAWNRRLGRIPDSAQEEDEMIERQQDRHALWTAMAQSQAATGSAPDADQPQLVVDAALAHVAASPCALAILPIEDIAGQIEQPNLPGTIDEHPNWRRRMPASTADLLKQPEIAQRLARIEEARR
ncbi:4-alpha-glucanotransferase [Blastomonas sp.]|uniref:4-alpha-glucanotransferase n=1 Tax=Blastomonas sp. TaxID=1909299 RepID=UPI00391CB717